MCQSSRYARSVSSGRSAREDVALAARDFDRVGNPGLHAAQNQLAGGMGRPFREVQACAVAFFGKFQGPARDLGAGILRSCAAAG